ncbi:MAG: PsiF family protein [Burkholderiales bacterium]
MKKLIAIICLSLISTYSLAGAQQEKMKTCSAEAKASGKIGPDRKPFMKQCMRGGMTDDEVKAKRAAKKEKSKACRAEAKASGKKGAEKKAMVKSCMAS